jgi:hypothetical protein
MRGSQPPRQKAPTPQSPYTGRLLAAQRRGSGRGRTRAAWRVLRAVAVLGALCAGEGGAGEGGGREGCREGAANHLLAVAVGSLWAGMAGRTAACSVTVGVGGWLLLAVRGRGWRVEQRRAVSLWAWVGGCCSQFVGGDGGSNSGVQCRRERGWVAVARSSWADRRAAVTGGLSVSPWACSCHRRAVSVTVGFPRVSRAGLAKGSGANSKTSEWGSGRWVWAVACGYGEGGCGLWIWRGWVCAVDMARVCARVPLKRGGASSWRAAGAVQAGSERRGSAMRRPGGGQTWSDERETRARRGSRQGRRS